MLNISPWTNICSFHSFYFVFKFFFLCCVFLVSTVSFLKSGTVPSSRHLYNCITLFTQNISRNFSSVLCLFCINDIELLKLKEVEAMIFPLKSLNLIREGATGNYQSEMLCLNQSPQNREQKWPFTHKRILA